MPTVGITSLEYVSVPVELENDAGQILDPTIYPAEIAFVTGRDPVDADFHVAAWLTIGQTHYARILVGPLGAVTLPAGVYSIFVRVTTGTERPVLPGGTLIVTTATNTPAGIGGPCRPWTTVPKVTARFPNIASSVDVDDYINAASGLLWRMSKHPVGVPFSGACPITVLPQRVDGCACGCHGGSLRTGVIPYGGGLIPWSFGSGWWDQESGCGCLNYVRLPGVARSVAQVKLSGVVVDPASYRLDDFSVLVRLGSAWPCCSRADLPDDQPGTFSITYVRGIDPPAEGILAATVLAGELALAGSPSTAGDCRLSTKVTQLVRQGVTVSLPPKTLFDGLPEVQAFLAAWPAATAKRGRVWAPGLNHPTRRQTG